MIGVAPIDDDRVAFGLIDVVGHGTASALISCSLIREMTDRIVVLLQSTNPDTQQECGRIAIEELNDRYCRLNLPGMYFTASGGRIRCATWSRPLLSGWQSESDVLRSRNGLARSAGQWLSALDWSIAPSIHRGGNSNCAQARCYSRSRTDYCGRNLTIRREALELMRALPTAPATRKASSIDSDKLAAMVQGRDRDDQSAMLISRMRAAL